MSVQPAEPYTPRGAAWTLMHLQAPEVLISGPAGTGKTRACLTKLHLLCDSVPHLRALVIRKTRASLTESALVTWESSVVPEGHPCLAGATRGSRTVYRYPNRSDLVVGGMDRASRIMSTEYDVVYVPEATELEEGEWEALSTRLRHGVLPYQQLLGDCNPDRPTHWLRLRCQAGRTVMLESRHEDNPRLWDGRAWTADGVEYLARLDALTGPRRLRLRHGRWVQAEGVVYEEWDPAVHLKQRFPIPPHWPRIWGVDFGYVHPFVWHAYAIDDDGRLWLYRQIHLSGRLVEDHARRILEVTRDEPRPVAIVCDHDREGRATLERHLGMRTTPARKDREGGVQAVRARLRRGRDGWPRVFVLRDSLDELDRERAAQRRPCGLEQEFDSYVWDTRGGRRTGEEPVKIDDDGLDVLRYVCATLDSPSAKGRQDPVETVLHL